MEFAADHLLTRALLTLNVLGFSLGPAIADFNRTHATNPLWTPHARFHVVWQVLTYCGMGLIALALIWAGGQSAVLRLWIAVALIVSVYLAFFATVIAMPRYGGSLADTNGVPPFGTLRFGGKAIALDTNLTLFCVQLMLLLIAVLAI